MRLPPAPAALHKHCNDGGGRGRAADTRRHGHVAVLAHSPVRGVGGEGHKTGAATNARVCVGIQRGWLGSAAAYGGQRSKPSCNLACSGGQRVKPMLGNFGTWQGRTPRT